MNSMCERERRIVPGGVRRFETREKTQQYHRKAKVAGGEVLNFTNRAGPDRQCLTWYSFYFNEHYQ